MTVEASGKYYIDAIIDKNTENAWRLTGFYGEPETARRIEAWNKLGSLNSQPNIPWLCVGDFNEITRQDEKVGSAIQPHNQKLDGVGTLKMANQFGKDEIEVW